jgi:hypothetical protein
MLRVVQSYLRPLLAKIYGFGILFLAWAHNDVSVLQRSPVFARLVEGKCPIDKL